MPVRVVEHLSTGIQAGGNRVHIDIKRDLTAINRQDLQMFESGFFLDLPDRDFKRIPVSVRMPARLKPLVQFTVVDQQTPLPVLRKHPAAGSDVPRQTISMKTIRSLLDQRADSLYDSFFLWKYAQVSLKQRKEVASIHGYRDACG